MSFGAQARDLLSVVEEVYGKGVKDPFKIINRARDFLWTIADIREEYFETRGCANVQIFTHQCRSDCTKAWAGISLPVDIAALKTLAYNGKRIKISTRDTFDAGIDAGDWCHCPEDQCLEAMSMGKDWVLPYDPCEIDCWVFEAENAEDNEARVGITYYDPEGRKHREDIVLNNDKSGTTYPVASLAENAITLPKRCGKITVLLAKSRKVLIEWDSTVEVPKYRRYAIKGIAPCQPISWRGTRRPHHIQYPTDFIEFGSDESLWYNVLLAQQLHFKTTKSAGESRAYADFVNYIIGAARSHIEALNPEYEYPTIEAMGDWDQFIEQADSLTGGECYGW